LTSGVTTYRHAPPFMAHGRPEGVHATKVLGRTLLLLHLKRDPQAVNATRSHSALDLRRGHRLEPPALRAVLGKHLRKLLAGHLAPIIPSLSSTTLYCGIPAPL